jgi:hypothetical protein
MSAKSLLFGGWCGMGGAGCSGTIKATTFNGTIKQLPNQYAGNVILIGMKSFIENVTKTSSEGSPLSLPESLKNVPNRFLTVGGENCKTKLPLVSNLIAGTAAKTFANELYNYCITANYTGLDFDCEGVLTLNIATQLVKLIKSNLNYSAKPISFQATLMASMPMTAPNFYENLSNFDTIALMTYGNSMNGSGWFIPSTAHIGTSMQESLATNNGQTWTYIKRWLNDTKIDKTKIILAMTPAGCTDHMVKFYLDIVNQFKLRGILFWRICEASKYIKYLNDSVVLSI